MKCSATGKRSYPTLADALDALEAVVERPELGSCYQCLRCGQWHISKRRFTLVRAKGRGKRRARSTRYGMVR
jgi:hypothetical protein